MPKPTHDLRIIVKSGESYPGSTCVTFRAHIVYVNQSTEGTSHEIGAILNPLRCTYGNDKAIEHLADLEISAQRHRDEDEQRWYGFELSYRNPYRVNLSELERMTKGLRAIQRKMDRLAERFGSPTDLATFCAHVADAIGCTDPRPFGQWHDDMQMNGTNYRWGDVDTLRYTWLDKM